jgi:hypothetical protein
MIAGVAAEIRTQQFPDTSLDSHGYANSLGLLECSSGFNFFYRISFLFTFSSAFCCKKVKLSLFLTNYPLCHEAVWGSGCIDPHFLHLGTSWR